MTETLKEGASHAGGAVLTFLMADVRGSTRFTLEHGDEAAALLATQFGALTREIVSAHEGAIIQLRGDEALAVFSSARQALRAAFTLQQRYARETMAETTLPLKVGIGLDAGEAIPVEGGYRGAVLNLAGRLCALAGPSEVLASEGVIHLAGKLEGLRYAERGAVQLKGFAHPVRVLQVVAEKTDQVERGAQAAAAVRERPLPIGGFLGALPAGPLVARDDELGTAMAAADVVAGGSGRLLFLGGEPGVGKTRLAQEVTLQLRNRGFLVATGRCYEPQEAVPFYPFLEALGTLSTAAPPVVREAIAQRWPYLGRLLPNQIVAVPPGSFEGQAASGTRGGRGTAMDGRAEIPFGTVLRRYRRDAELTQEELAERAGLSVRGIGYLERESSHAPYQATVFQLADALELSPADRSILLAASRRLPPHSTRLPSMEDQERLLWSVTGFVQALADQRPMALLLDDLHWADASSLTLLQHLARHTRAYAVMLLCTYRDVELGRQHRLAVALRDLDREQVAEHMAIRRLGKDGTATLIATSFGEEEVAAEFAELVYRQTEGNPFFTQEVLRALVERGDIHQEDGRWERREVGEMEVPESIRSTIGERLSRLSEDAQAILHEASVFGQTFGFDQLQAIGGREADEVEAALKSAMAAGLLRAEKDEYAFNHALTQQALYAELSGRRKRRLHLAAGEALERLPPTDRTERAAELAWHFLQGADPERALRYATVAGDQAEAVFAHGEAERHYRVALELAQERGETSTESELLEKRGRALNSMGRYDEALKALGQAAEKYRRANDVEAQARVAAQIGRVHADQGTSDEGIAYTERMLEALEGGDPSPGMAALYAALAFLYFAAGRYREQQVAAERASELARRFGNDELLAAAEVRRGSALLLLGQREQALAVLEDAIPLAERVGDLVSLHRALAAVAELYRVGGQFDQSKLHRERALEMANRLGTPATIAFAMATLGRVYFLQGAWEEAGALLERALTIAGSTSSWFAAYPSLHLGELRLAQGACDEASQLLDMAATIGRRNSDMQAMRFAHRALAERDLSQGRPEAARERLEPLLDRPGLTEEQVTMLLPVLARAELEAGNLERAERVLAETMSRAAAQNARLATLDALRVRGVLFSRQRRWTDARHTFERATAMAHAMPYPYAEARTLYELGLMHGETDAPQQARECLEEALAIFQRLGAQPYIKRTEQALAEIE